MKNFIKLNRNEEKDIEIIDITKTEEPEKKEEKKGMKKGVKVAIGAGITAIVTGLLYFAAKKNQDQTDDILDDFDDSDELVVDDLDSAVDTVE